MSADIRSGSEPEDLARRENLEEFMSAMQGFVDSGREEGREENVYLTDYLQEVALYTDADKEDDDTPKVTLMTIHAAKGLEFPYCVCRWIGGKYIPKSYVSKFKT